jgi:hypothetical protein
VLFSAFKCIDTRCGCAVWSFVVPYKKLSPADSTHLREAELTVCVREMLPPNTYHAKVSSK